MDNIEIFHFTDSSNNGAIIYNKLFEENPEACFSILIDNYHFNHTIDLIPSEIKKKSHIIAFEKSFVTLAQEIIYSLNTEVVESNLYLKDTKILLKKESKYTCAILTTAWYLARLGLIKYPPDTYINSNHGQIDRIVNVLDIKFKKNEEKVVEIIRQYLGPKFSSSNIKYIFYDKNGVSYEGL